MTTEAFQELVDNIPYLTVLPAKQKARLFTAAHPRTFETNEIIFLEGDEVAGLWLIQTGQVKISRLSTDGDEYILHLLNAGESFNDIAVLENSRNPANATALSDTQCWMLPVETIQSLLDTQPQVAKAAITMLTGRVRLLAQQLENLALYSVTARLARFLLQQGDSPVIEGGVTRIAIAAHLATTPETISRALRHLEQSGAIAFTRYHIEITNTDILQALAHIEPT